MLNPPELITSLVVKFTDSSDVSRTFSAAFRDPDGPGGTPPVKFDTIRLAPFKTYKVSVLLLDETKNPVDSVSEEIWKERNDHQLFFNYNTISINAVYLDADDKGYPVGLSTKWRTGSAGKGTSQVRLKHQVGVKNGTDIPGETDIDVSFQTTIQ